LEENTGLKKLGTNENNQKDSSNGFFIFSFLQNLVLGLQQTLVFLSVVFCYSKQLNLR
jgi:hypothetical protein